MWSRDREATLKVGTTSDSKHFSSVTLNNFRKTVCVCGGGGGGLKPLPLPLPLCGLCEVWIKVCFSKKNLWTYPDNRGFSWDAKNGEKKNLWRYRVKILLSMTQYTLERGWSPISSLAILIRRAPFWPADMRAVDAREWRNGLKTGFTTSLTSVTSPNSWTTYRAYSTAFWHDLIQRFFFSLHFSRARKNLLSGYCVP